MMMSLSGCVTFLVGSGSTVALATVQERTIGEAIDDTVIKFNINAAWLKEDSDIFRDCSMTVSDGRVLLTGVVTTSIAMRKAVKLTWQVDGVKEVINEIFVNPNGKSIAQSSTDAWIATKIRAKLLANKDVLSINYSIDVNNSNVYLIGIAQDSNELDTVINIIRNTNSVESVTSYVKMKHRN